MTKALIAIAAAAKAAAGGSPLFVFASNVDDLPDDDKSTKAVFASAKYAVFACKSCDTHMNARADTSPFCVTCGSGDVVSEATADTKQKGVTASSLKKDMVSLQCGFCNHATVMEEPVSNAIVASSGGSVHCSCCGKPMFMTAAAEDGAEGGSQELTPMDNPTKMEKFSEAPAPSTAAAEDEDIDLDDLDTLDAATASSTGDDMTTPDTPKIEADVDDMVLEPFSMIEEEDPLLSDDMLDDPMGSTEVFEDEMLDPPEIDGDPLVDAMELDDTEMALAFVRANGRVVAMKGAYAIAAFTRKSAGENYAIANSDALPAAAKAAVGHEGLRAGLVSVGFELLKVPTRSDAITARKVQEIQASANKKEELRRKETASTFALAAAGLNRGQWKGFENPILSTLIRELGNMGVQSPKRVAASILNEAGMEYAETLLKVSTKLSSMSASARKDLADSLEMTNAVTASVAEDEDEAEDVVASTVEARFSKPVLVRASVASTSQGVTAASAILAGTAPLSFASV